MWIQVLLMAAGFVLLYYGANWLVKGAANLAESLGITPMVIGLTVVAFGTSAPELVVSVMSSLAEKSMIAVGNAVGSNICNIALVLGATACLMPMTTDKSVIRRDIPLMVALSAFLLVLTLDSRISRIDGACLFGGIILYTIFNYVISVRESRLAAGAGGGVNRNAASSREGISAADDEHVKQARELISEFESGVEEIGHIESKPLQILLIIIGIAGVVFGARILIDAAVVVMTSLGVSEKFIGLTIVALGTSLPELATSVIAALRKEMDISIGNLVGSNVFNLLSVIGAAALVRPISIPGGFLESGLIYDYLMMMAVSILPWFMMKKDNTLHRSGGLVLLSCYFGYMIYLVIIG
ncbi:MAG: calcium/sodium antiporter [Desulfobacterales bacterium]